MEKKCIRILRIVSVMNRGGIETQIMNIYRKIDRSKFQFDFLVTRDEVGVFDAEIEKLGGRIYRIPSVKKVGLVKFINNFNKFFKKHSEYRIVHSHMNTWSGLFLNIVKKHKIPVRIAQSHSAQQGNKNLSIKSIIEDSFKSLMWMFIKFGATHYWAVGQAAGEWLYGRKIARSHMNIIPNAKDLKAYKFDSFSRERLRKDLGIPLDALVIGHVGSFSPVKNHTFLIDIFSELINQKECYLCLVGDGPLRNDVEKNISGENIKNKVVFLGLRNDVNKLMSLFDIFVLPSKFEGMPNVIIEAQAAALPCVISNNVTKEVDMGLGLVDFLPLQKNPKEWCRVIINKSRSNRLLDNTKIKDNGYDLDSFVEWLQDFYLKV